MSSILGSSDSRSEIEALLAGQNRIFEMIATDGPLEETLNFLLLLIESQFDGMLCSILLLDSDGLHVHHAAAPSLPKSYCAAIDGIAIGPRVGWCGTAMHRGERVIVTDILDDPLWDDYRMLASQHGLRSCWSTPIVSHQGKILGSFAMYYREPRSPSSAEIQMTDVGTRIARIAIERWQADLERRQTAEILAHELIERKEREQRLREFERVVESVEEIIMVVDREYRYVIANQAYLKYRRKTREQIIGKRVAEILDPEFFEQSIKKQLDECFSGQVVKYELRYRYPEIGERDLFASYFPIEGPDGVSRVAVILQDITQRKEALARLEESEKRFRAVYERAPFGIALSDPASGRFLSVNPRYCEIAGRSEDEMLRLDFQSITHPDDLAGSISRARALATGIIPYMETEKRYVRPDGSVVTVNVKAAPLEGQPGLHRCNLVMAQDITEREQTRTALQRSEQSYRMFVAQSSEGIFRQEMNAPIPIHVPGEELIQRILTESYIAECNDPLAKMYGFASSRDLIGKRLMEVMAKADSRYVQLTRDFVRSGFRVRDRESTEVDQHGNPKVFLKSMTGIVEDGRLVRTWGIQRDITEWVRLDEARKETEEALRNAELKYRTIFEQAVIGIFQSTPDGTLLSANPALARMFGYDSPGDLIACVNDRSRHFYVDAESPHEFARAMAQTGGVKDFECRVYRKNGSIMWLSVSARVIREGGVAVCYEGTSEDITDRRLLERQLLRSQKLEAVGRLAGGIAHDFNNVLGVIIGQGQLLLRKLAPTDPSRRAVEQIFQAGKRAASLTGQLLAFSRQQFLSPTSMDLNSVIEDFSEMLSALVGEDVRLVKILDPDLGRISADAGQIEQVLINLVVNARDAMPQGGTITLQTSNMELDDEFVRRHDGARQGHCVVLRVNDTGTGIDEHTAARLFEPFFTTKQVGKGTGLGLATVYGIVKQSGGHILVDTVLGKGTSFSIFFPFFEGAWAAESGEKAAAPTTLALGNETILLVEDAVPLREVIRGFLKEAGYAVLEAGDAAEALETAQRYNAEISLLITDIVLPGVNGRALAEQFVSRRPGTKILYISGYTNDAAVRQGVLQSEFAFLEKPFTQDALTNKVREILDAAA